jgi:Uma2 family endonuclease
MVARRSARPATYADIESLPPNMVGEIIDGVLYANPRPASAHARAATALGGDLDGPFNRGKGGPGGWLILFEPELHFDADVLVPDHAGWRRERMPEMPHTAFFILAPDWVSEILSPSTAALDRTEKLPVYARRGVGHVWLIDPLAKTLEVLRLDGSTYRIVGSFHDDARVRAEPFDAVEIELAALWAR